MILSAIILITFIGICYMSGYALTRTFTFFVTYKWLRKRPQKYVCKHMFAHDYAKPVGTILGMPVVVTLIMRGFYVEPMSIERTEKVTKILSEFTLPLLLTMIVLSIYGIIIREYS